MHPPGSGPAGERPDDAATDRVSISLEAKKKHIMSRLIARITEPEGPGVTKGDAPGGAPAYVTGKDKDINN